ncbi:glycosyltransferase family 2 protein [Paenibacillus oenotherae]|uniref:Glycosyltransferase family 2 protein n=1 Tax=Paenibacillus oenotherae TaxID=1435645 RepID=A0ABS7D421_9BACL|nr:glycosyltransferase family 2 protein [Paenibacillus oenotherae]MBW7474674.1 glycosyltransferase family 2 protein [Paenibacillus oenotherae]
MKERMPLPEISVIVPVYNEAGHIAASLRVIAAAVAAMTARFELIVIDDGSKDGTWEQVAALSHELEQLTIMRLSRNFGKELALCAGLEHAQGQAVILMDGDLQHPPELIPQMIAMWREQKLEVIECVKESRGKESAGKRLGASLFYYVLNGLSGFNLRDASDYKLMDAKVVAAWRSMPERIPFFRGMSAWLGYKRATISFRVPAREEGSSRFGLHNLTKLAVHAIVAFSTIPLRLVSLVGILFLLGSALLGINTLVQKLQGVAVTGFTTVILLLLIIGSFLMISLGIIGEYIAAIYHEVKGRPRYLIAEQHEGAYSSTTGRERLQSDAYFSASSHR